MEIQIYRLTFKAALHLADVRQDYGTSEVRLHSDTIHAALMSVLDSIGYNIPKDGKMDYSLSSLFPFRANSKGFDYFFPKPMLSFNTTFEHSLLAKKMKKVEWLDKAYFEKVISNQEIFLFGDASDDMKHFQGSFLANQEYKVPIMSFQTLPRVKVPRDYAQKDSIGEFVKPEPFYMQQIYFAEGAGLYFMATGNTDLLDKAMNVLQHEGIGTDRYVGNGHFFYEKDKITLNLPKNTTQVTNLSLFCPLNKEQLDGMLGGNGNYDLVKRSGWVTSDAGLGVRRKSVHMFKEGSVFQVNENQSDLPYIFGNQAIDISPDASILPDDKKALHKIWRNGQSLFIPVNQ